MTTCLGLACGVRSALVMVMDDVEVFGFLVRKDPGGVGGSVVNFATVSL